MQGLPGSSGSPGMKGDIGDTGQTGRPVSVLDLSLSREPFFQLVIVHHYG